MDDLLLIYLWLKKMQLFWENEKAFLSMQFNLNHGTASFHKFPAARGEISLSHIIGEPNQY